VGRQLLVVLTGEAEVAGAEGAVRRLTAGQGAVWEPGEVHETRSPGGMTAVIVEGDLDIGAPGEQVDPGDV
jgi:quercetin dioxygenase-like cupin family protein